MKNYFLSCLLFFTLLGLVIYYLPERELGAVQTIGLYPDPRLTPGKAETLLASDLTKSYAGQTYSQAHRNVPQSEKTAVCREYACTGTVEIDHFYPLCAGGSNDITNLWAEPEHVMVKGEDLGFHTKDKLEAYICREIKAGILDPKVAFQKMTTDWVGFYHEITNTP